MFVEVKTRRLVRGASSAPYLFESITAAKQARLLRLARIFLDEHLPPGLTCTPRIDLVGVECPSSLTGRAKVTHLPDAVERFDDRRVAAN